MDKHVYIYQSKTLKNCCSDTETQVQTKISKPSLALKKFSHVEKSESVNDSLQKCS